MIVAKANSSPKLFVIYFVVPNTKYIVQVLIGGLPVYDAIVEASDMPESTEYELNNGFII